MTEIVTTLVVRLIAALAKNDIAEAKKANERLRIWLDETEEQKNKRRTK